MRKLFITFLRLITIFALAAVMTSAWRGHKESIAFDQILLGDTLEHVLINLGEPNFQESSGQTYTRYTSTPCIFPCQSRLWWENNWLPGIGALSIEIDTNGRVLSKYRWFSP